jgi:hypothetical protein
VQIDCLRIDKLTTLSARPHTSRRWLACIAASLAITSGALAQQAKKPDFATIRKTELKDIDRNNVDAWIGQEIQRFLGATDDAALAKQGREFVETVSSNVRDASATPKFREGMATMLANAFTKQFKSAPATRRPLAGAYPLIALEQIGLPLQNVIDAYKLGLTDTASAGRSAAASGLRSIRDKLTDQQWSDVLPLIQKAGAAEPNAVALGHMYRFLMVGSGPRAQAAAGAVLAILDTRLARFADKKGWPVPADADAVKWLGPQVATMANAQQQNQATLAIARLLTHAVYAYVSKPGDNFVEPLERIAVTSEAQLRQVVSRRATGAELPNVTATMLEKVPADNNAVLLALNKWIGTAQQEGTLNKAPFGFDRGLKIQPPAATQPSAAPAPEAKPGTAK